MKSKDTIMNSEQLSEVVYMAVESPDRLAGESWQNKQRQKAIAKAQAEISFKAGQDDIMRLMPPYFQAIAKDNYKAGIKEVVDWIEEHQRMTYEYGKGEVAFNHINWHTKLKEWGL